MVEFQNKTTRLIIRRRADEEHSKKIEMNQLRVIPKVFMNICRFLFLRD